MDNSLEDSPTDKHPDIEIYAKRAPIEDIIAWLEEHFEVTSDQSKPDGRLLDLTYQKHPVQCLIFEKAARGGYSSIWFKDNHTPWPTDLDCATEAFNKLGVEVRCSKDGWSNDAAEEGNWIRITDQGQSVVNWRT